MTTCKDFNTGSPRRKCRSVRGYLKGITSSTYRSRIRAGVRHSRARAGLPPSWDRVNRALRNLLVTAIFEVENALESRCLGQPDHPAVIEMRAVRHRVEADLGWGHGDDDEQPVEDGQAASDLVGWGRGDCEDCGRSGDFVAKVRGRFRCGPCSHQEVMKKPAPKPAVRLLDQEAKRSCAA